MYNFKKLFTYLVVGALVIALSISCKSNEDPGSGPLEVSEESGNSKDITIIITDLYEPKARAATVGFSVSGASDYNVSIQSVDSGSNPKLDASDFSYDKYTKELTLKESCITNKLNNANLTPATPYQYTITFKFVDSSDTSKEKTIDVKVNLYNAKVITKTEIEDMIKSIGEVSVNASDNGGGVAKFDFSSAPFGIIGANFNVNEKDKKEGTYKISTARDEMVKAIKETKDYDTYFSYYNFNFNKEEVSDDKKSLTLYIQFTLKGGYALSSEVAHLTSDGLSIKLTLRSGENWVE